MKRLCTYKALIIVIGLVLLFLPAAAGAQTGAAKAEPAPIAQQLVREGDLAIKLMTALGIGDTDDEVEAENQLSQVGILPKNGWIADYPATPDIIGELQQKTEEAAVAGKLSIGREEAMKRFAAATAELKLAVKPHTADKNIQQPVEISEDYPDPGVINDYYATEGPPVVTYYTPPPDYYYLYSWVPYPFWWTGLWFPGFFVLNDFQRTIVVHNRVCFVSNHFRDVRAHRAFRIDPVGRFRGRTFAGIGVTNRRSFLSTGVPRSERTIFNGSRARFGPPAQVRSVASGSRGGYRSGMPAGRSSVIRSAPVGGREMRSAPYGGGGMRSAPSRGGGMGRGGDRRR